MGSIKKLICLRIKYYEYSSNRMADILPLKRIASRKGASATKRHSDNSANLPIGNVSQYRFDKLLKLQIMGNGSFGTACLAIDTITDKSFVVKVVAKTDLALIEIGIGMNMHSQFVCKTFGYAENNSKFYIIMEKAGNKDLFTFISENPRIFMENPSLFWFVASRVLQGLLYIHSRGYIHNDIKPENICIVSDESSIITDVKIIDFGFSIKTGEQNVGACGTPNYMDPSVVCGMPASQKSDIWSVGIVFYAMLNGTFPKPISSRHPNKLLNKRSVLVKLKNIYESGKFSPFPEQSSDPKILEIQDFIERCLVIQSEKRPTVKELLQTISLDFTQELSELRI